MTFKLVEYEVLKKNILYSIKSLARYYDYSNISDFIDAYLGAQYLVTTPAELAKKYVNIPPQRRSQIGFLLTVIRCLDDELQEHPHFSEKNKNLLNAAACYVREIINHTYDPKVSWKNYWASFITSVDGSYFFRFLGSALGINLINIPSCKEAAELYRHLKEFILSRTYKDPDNPKQGYLDDPAYTNLDNQTPQSLPNPRPFSEKRIEDFIVEDFIKELIECISRLEQQEFEYAKEEHQRKDKATMSGLITKVGIFSQVEGTCRDSSLNDHLKEQDAVPKTEHELFVSCML